MPNPNQPIATSSVGVHQPPGDSVVDGNAAATDEDRNGGGGVCGGKMMAIRVQMLDESITLFQVQVCTHVDTHLSMVLALSLAPVWPLTASL